MKKHILFILAGLLVSFTQSPVLYALEAPANLLIVAVQTAQVGAAGNDMVEIYNPGTQSVDVTGWKLQYRAAAATGTATWTTKRTIACVVAATGCTVVLTPAGHLVFSTYDIMALSDEQPMASGFSDVGGQLRLVQPGATTGQVIVHDIVGYGTAAEAEGGLAALAPAAGETIVRRALSDVAVLDTNVNGTDFELVSVGCYVPGQGVVCVALPPNEDEDTVTLPNETPVDSLPPVIQPDVPPTTPEPQASDSSQPPAPSSTDSVEESDQSGQGAGPVAAAAPLVITELLPDPASPSLDSTDEFIELFNPGAVAVVTDGYRLQTGADFRYSFTLMGVTVPAGGYVAVFSSQSHLALSNSGTQVRLLGPAGEVLDVVASYGKAKEGQAWARQSGQWQWTTTPTPDGANVITTPPSKVSAAVTALSKKASSAKKKTAATSTTKSKTTAKVASAKTGATSDDTQDMQPAPTQSTNLWLLLSIGAMAVAYGAYEYRQDIGRLARRTWLKVSRHKAADPD